MCKPHNGLKRSKVYGIFVVALLGTTRGIFAVSVNGDEEKAPDGHTEHWRHEVCRSMQAVGCSTNQAFFVHSWIEE